MDAASIKKWVRDEILGRGFDGTCGVAKFSVVYNDLIPVQKKELEKILGNNINTFSSKGSFVSMAIFHTEKAIKSINTTKNGKTDYEKWNFYANEYNLLNNILNDISSQIASIMDGIPLKATSELGRVRSVEEYYPYAKLSHRVVAEHAGLGTRGKNELIVTKQNGCAVRFNSFLTPRELKVEDELQEDLCEDCTACLDSCKILSRKQNLQNYRRQCMERINALNLKYPVCGVCVRACYENGHWRNNIK
jgi:hypothetical protein